MPEPGNGPREFEVHGSDAIINDIRRVHRQGWLQGRGQVVTMALHRILRRLKLDPFHAGEEAYHLPGLRMQIRTIVAHPIAVHFAVCEDRPLVFIKDIKLLSPRSP